MYRFWFLALLVALPAAAQNAPQVLERVLPVLPDTSNVQGAVGLTVFVDTTGRPMRVRVHTPLRPDADSAAVRAVRQWRFAPVRTETGRAMGGMVRVRVEVAPALPEWLWARNERVSEFSSFPDVLTGSESPRHPLVAFRLSGVGCATYEAPQKRSGLDPYYPSDLRRAGRESRLVTLVRLDREGRVAELLPIEATDSDFWETTLAALRTWRYSPALCDGEAVSVLVPIPVRFRQGG